MHSARTRKINNNTKNNMQADTVDGGEEQSRIKQQSKLTFENE